MEILFRYELNSFHPIDIIIDLIYLLLSSCIDMKLEGQVYLQSIILWNQVRHSCQKLNSRKTSDTV